MKNVDISITEHILTIRVDLNKNFGLSKSGKSTLIATTEGNQLIATQIYLGMNVYEKGEKL